MLFQDVRSSMLLDTVYHVRENVKCCIWSFVAFEQVGSNKSVRLHS